MNDPIVFNLHDLVCIRLVDATNQDIATVTRQLGLQPSATTNPVDITIRFCDSIATSTLTFLGLDNAAYDENGFYVLPSSGIGGKVRIPFDCIGGACEIVCERGIRSIPMLNLILNLTFIRKDHIPVHASAFMFEGTGVLVVAWATGGKTEALLAFAERGAEYVGDEWVILSPSGEMFGIPTRTSIKEWQFRQLPNLNPKVGIQRRLFIAGVHLADRVNKLFVKSGLGGLFVAKALHRGLPSLRKEMKIWVMPRSFFKTQFCERPVSIDTVFLIVMHEDPEIIVEPSDADAIAERMLASHEFEYSGLVRLYNAYKFAFPDRRNDLLENLWDTQRQLLGPVLRNKPAFTVARPYPVSLSTLYQQMAPFCRT